MVESKKVGKTSIISSLFGRINEVKIIPTIGADYANKYYLFHNELKICLEIWDFSGKESFNSVNLMYFKKWDACVHVFDGNDLNTLKPIPNLIQITEEEFRKGNTNKKGFHFLLANKIDLVDEETKHFFDVANSPSLNVNEINDDWQKIKHLMTREYLYLLSCSSFEQKSVEDVFQLIASTLIHAHEDGIYCE
ncbi:hypothetical protein SNEBB_010818, partial [Seison nebaliae]